MNIQVNVNDKSGSTLQKIAVDTAKKQQVIFKQPNSQVTFDHVDLETGVAPQQIVAKRVGNDLEITFEGSDSADLIIKDYYSDSRDESPIIGLAENGQYYAYLPETGVTQDSIAMLTDNLLATEVLGGEAVGTTPIWGNIPYWGWIAGALAAVGAGVALGSGGGSSGGSGNGGQQILRQKRQPK